MKYHCLNVFASRSEDNFKHWWEEVEKTAIEAGVEEPALPRNTRAPKCYDDKNMSRTLPASPKDYYYAIYFECLDTLTAWERIEQELPHL